MFEWIVSTLIFTIVWPIGSGFIVNVFFILYNHYKNKKYHYEDWMSNLTNEEKILVEQYIENIHEDE